MSEENIKLLRGEPEKAINHLAWPIVLSMILTSLYMLIDGIWITGLGQTAIAGVGFVTPIFMILNGVSVGLGVGATSLISRYVGAKNRENASKSATHSIIIFTITSILLTILLLLIQKPALIMYGATGQALTEGLNYSTILFAGLFAFIFANGGTGIICNNKHNNRPHIHIHPKTRNRRCSMGKYNKLCNISNTHILLDTKR